MTIIETTPRGALPSPVPDAWPDAVTAWVEHLVRHQHASAPVQVRRDGQRLLRATQRLAQGPWTADAEQIDTAVRSTALPPAEVVATLVAFRRFYTWATAERHVRRSPLTTLPIGTWDGAVAAFADHLDHLGQPAPSSAADYCRRVFTYGRNLPVGPWEVTGPMLQNDMDSRDWSTTYRKSTLVALRSFYRWAIQSGRVEHSPLLGVSDGGPARPGPARHRVEPVWREPIGGYLATLQAAGRRPATLALRRGHLERLSREFADPWAVTPQTLAGFLSSGDWAPEYRRAVRGSVQLFYRWATITGHIDVDPAASLMTVRVPRALPRPAPDDAVLAAFETADDRTRLVIELGMYAGLRIGEVAALQESDVLGDRLRVVGKGGHQRFVPLHPTLAVSLSAYRSERLHQGITTPWLFPSTRSGHMTAGVLGRHVSDALPGGWTHHTLRHKFATQAYATTRDLLAVQELLGHSKPETTARYAQVPDGALHDAVAGVGLSLDRNRKPQS